MLTTVCANTQTPSITLLRVELLRLLDRARHVVPTRYSNPVLTCVRLQASKGLLQLNATDGDLSLYAHVFVDGQLPACLVAHAELVRRLKASRNDTCSLGISEDGEHLIINGGRVEHALQTLDLKEFPVVATEYAGETISVDAAELCQALKLVGIAVAREPIRYATDGVLLEAEQKGTRLVATDGRRMAINELCCVEHDFEGTVILPGKLTRLIGKLTEKKTDYLVLAIEPSSEKKGNAPKRVFAAGPDWLLSSWAADGNFPYYRDVVPRSHSRFATERKALLDAVSEVAVSTSEASRVVAVDLLADEIRLSAGSPDTGTSTASLPCRFLGGGDSEIHTGFNPVYLLDALKSLSGDSIVIDIDQNGFGTDGKVFGKPVLLYPEHEPFARWVIMPVNLQLAPTRSNLGSNYRADRIAKATI